MNPPHKGKLPRLDRHHYQGHAVVFWTNTLEERARGWLSPSFHAVFRELMLHAAERENLGGNYFGKFTSLHARPSRRHPRPFLR